MLAGPVLKRDVATYMDLCAEQSRLLRQPSEVAYRSISLGPSIESRLPWYCVLSRAVLPHDDDVRHGDERIHEGEELRAPGGFRDGVDDLHFAAANLFEDGGQGRKAPLPEMNTKFGFGQGQVVLGETRGMAVRVDEDEWRLPGLDSQEDP